MSRANIERSSGLMETIEETAAGTVIKGSKWGISES